MSPLFKKALQELLEKNEIHHVELLFQRKELEKQLIRIQGDIEILLGALNDIAQRDLFPPLQAIGPKRAY